MSGLQFFQTRMGHQLIEVTLPKIAAELGQLNATLQSIATALQTPPSASTARRGAQEAAGTDLTAMIGQIAREHLPLDVVEPQADALGLHDTVASALGIALRAAYQAGVAATLRTMRADLHDGVATPR